MKKRRKKLQLSRETLRHLNPTDLSAASGGWFPSTTEHCTINCTGALCTEGQKSYCFCQECQDTNTCPTDAPTCTHYC